MRKVILQEFVTLNGLAVGPGGSIDFIPASSAGDESFGKNQESFIDSIDAILLGRVTYEMFAQYWPNVTSGPDKPFADKLNAIPKVVVSSTLERAPWGTFDEATIVKGGVAKEIGRMKQKAGKDIVLWGSISLAQSMMSDGLIDEYQLIVCPVVLGGGRSLFETGLGSLRLVRTKTFDRGTVLLAYEPASSSGATQNS